MDLSQLVCFRDLHTHYSTTEKQEEEEEEEHKIKAFCFQGLLIQHSISKFVFLIPYWIQTL